MPVLPEFRLETYFSKWEFVAKHHMTASDAQSMSLEELLDLGTSEDRRAFARSWLGYTQTWGDPELREVIAQTYDTLTYDQVLCFAGAQEGIYAAAHALLSAGDHAIVLVPNYQSIETIALSLCDVTGIALDAQQNWSLDLDHLSKLITPRTRLIAINFPNNPTGKILKRSTFDGLIRLCREHGIWLFSDEVYRLIERDPAIRLPQVADVYERGLSLNVMSKSYGLPGLRIGWLACQDRTILDRMEKFKHYLSLCNSAPSERLASIALKQRETILSRTRAVATHNLPILKSFFEEYPNLFHWVEPDGGLVGFPRYMGQDGVENFANQLVNSVGVLVLPSSIYRSELLPVPTDHFRIGYGRKGIEQGLEAMHRYLQKDGNPQ